MTKKLAGGGVELITSFLDFLWAVLQLLGFVLKLWITPFMMKLDLVNVASIG